MFVEGRSGVMKNRQRKSGKVSVAEEGQKRLGGFRASTSAAALLLFQNIKPYVVGTARFYCLKLTVPLRL